MVRSYCKYWCIVLRSSSSHHPSISLNACDDVVQIARLQNDRGPIRLEPVISAAISIYPRTTRTKEWNRQTDAAVVFHPEIPFGFFLCANYRRPKTNHAKTSILQGERCPRKLSLGDAQVGFCPCGRILFRGSTVAFFGSVAGAQRQPSLDTLGRILQRLLGVNSTEV